MEEESLAKRESCGQRTSQGLAPGPYLLLVPGLGKCWEPEELNGRASGEADLILCPVKGSHRTEVYHVCKLRSVLENRCEPPSKSSVTHECNAVLATLNTRKGDELLV